MDCYCSDKQFVQIQCDQAITWWVFVLFFFEYVLYNLERIFIRPPELLSNIVLLISVIILFFFLSQWCLVMLCVMQSEL